MDRIHLMEALEKRAFEARIGLSHLCHRAGLSRTIATRWQNDRSVVPLLPTIGKLENAMDIIEKEKVK